MNSNYLLPLLFVLILTSCGVKAPPKPKNNNFPSFIEQHKKVLRPGQTRTQSDEDEANSKK